jgi:hypothetical protein
LIIDISFLPLVSEDLNEKDPIALSSSCAFASLPFSNFIWSMSAVAALLRRK